jgi:hypothetical protein
VSVTLKRLLVFVLLGPPLGMLTGLLGLLPIVSFFLGDPASIDVHQITALPALIPVAYVIGLAPALLVGLLDEALYRWDIGHRILWCAVFGFAVSFLPLLTSLMIGFIHGPFLLLFGLIGAVSGAVCSWLAGRKERNLAAFL